LAKGKDKQYIYIVQASLEPAKCKIGKTNDLDRRLKDIFIEAVERTKPSLEERGVSKKDILQKAQKAKNDEFYTRYEDVEKEISMYSKTIWKNKVVFCNCDDAVDADERITSAFSLYFIKHFKELELKN